MRAACSLQTFDGFDENQLFCEAAVFSICHQRRTTHHRIRAFNTHIHTWCSLQFQTMK